MGFEAPYLVLLVANGRTNLTRPARDPPGGSESGAASLKLPPERPNRRTTANLACKPPRDGSAAVVLAWRSRPL